jgi:transposase-like protein
LRKAIAHQRVKAEAVLAAARRRAETVVEIDTLGLGRGCPHCGIGKRTSRGATRAGAQRWRCKDGERTRTGRTGSPLSRIHRPGLFIEGLRNMPDPDEEPVSCRRFGRRLWISRDTVWRWRMIVFEDLKAVLPSAMSGMIETYRRARRKGSREEGRYQRDTSQPKTTPQPP